MARQVCIMEWRCKGKKLRFCEISFNELRTYIKERDSYVYDKNTTLRKLLHSLFFFTPWLVSCVKTFLLFFFRCHFILYNYNLSSSKEQGRGKLNIFNYRYFPLAKFAPPLSRLKLIKFYCVHISLSRVTDNYFKFINSLVGHGQWIENRVLLWVSYSFGLFLSYAYVN